MKMRMRMAWLMTGQEEENVVGGDEGGDEELASRLKHWVGTRLDDVAVKDEHKVKSVTFCQQWCWIFVSPGLSPFPRGKPNLALASTVQGDGGGDLLRKDSKYFLVSGQSRGR